jgi:hypothetical protein
LVPVVLSCIVMLMLITLWLAAAAVPAVLLSATGTAIGLAGSLCIKPQPVLLLLLMVPAATPCSSSACSVFVMPPQL